MCELAPLAFSTWGEAESIAREMGALLRELSMILQDTLSCRSRVYLEKQAAARRGRPDPEYCPQRR